jgi:2-polyprenyl-6-methoxyphenol hydroxylase-like FAD-dependent oxidoreductase
VRYLVGADGGRGFVRDVLDIGFPDHTLGVRAVLANVVLTGLGRDAWHRFHEGSITRQMALCPLAGTDLFQLQAPIPLEGDVTFPPKASRRCSPSAPAATTFASDQCVGYRPTS